MLDWLSKPEWLAAIAAGLSALTTCIAAWTAFMGPLRAAELAEKLRSSGDASSEKRRAKLEILAVLMAHRKSYWLNEPMNAFNLIDVVYNDCREVRSAWAELYLAFTNEIPEHVREERLRKVLGAMSKDLGLADELRTDDFGRVYTPTAAVEEQLLSMHQRRAALARFEGTEVQPSANTAGPQAVSLSFFPPKPD
jgi:hypothetical protein